MITSLSIENFALIEKLSISFTSGFSIITGETGAGKSILLGALGLALGKRADLASLKNKEEKCIIEACFKISGYNLQSFFEANDLDYDDETIIRREILPSGKSRAFVNDSPVNLQELQELSDYLIDIHSQHQTRALSEDNFQFRIIDSIASNSNDLAQYAAALKAYRILQLSLTQLQFDLRESMKEQDYTTFLLEELLAAQLKSDEQSELEALQSKLSNVEFIKENLDKSMALASEERYGIIQNMTEFKAALQRISTLSPEYQNLFERVQSSLIEFDDLFRETERAAEDLSGDPQQLEVVNQKLQTIYNLQKKHNVDSVAALIDIQNKLDNKVISASELENAIAKIEKSIFESESVLNKLAQTIHNNRVQAIPTLSDQLIAILQNLGMPNVRFNIEFNSVENYLPNGKDELQFLFSANKGSDFGLLKKVASGGEMSRIMLAVKSILSQYSKLPTIIFDEIDTGVSGDIANKMGDIMKDMSAEMQVFAITHLPQIAAKGNQHFKVYKLVSGEQTQSDLKLLNADERIVEIAQMLSGSEVSDSAINHAKALLN